MKDHQTDRILEDPLSPALRAALRRSCLLDTEKQLFVDFLQKIYGFSHSWEKNVIRAPGQNFNPQISRQCQIYLEHMQSPALEELCLLAVLNLPNEEDARSLYSSLKLPLPYYLSEARSWCEDTRTPDVADTLLFQSCGNVLSVFALDEIRHLHLDRRDPEILHKRIVLADILTHEYKVAKLTELLRYALTRFG